MKLYGSIMQPHFFPWSGYFNLISKSDIFIFLDDAQYSKNSWQSRNKINLNNNEIWITAHTQKSSLKNTKINEKKIEYNNWKIKLIKTLKQSYAKYPGEKDLTELLNYFEEIKPIYLSDLNINLIKFISKRLKINTKFILSSKYNIDEKRSKKILKLLNICKITDYISVPGSKDYLIEDQFIKLSSSNLIFNNYLQPEYLQQKKKEFKKNLSIIDVIANLGWIETSKYVRRN